MDRAMLQEHLALAERHIANGKDILTRQAELIEHMASRGLDTADAQRLLAEFKESFAQHVGDRDRLRSELGLPPA